MAKKRQFKDAKYEDGILSYNYLGGKGGKGGGDVSIKKKGDNWYFVDDEGKIRADVGDGGKLTSTHIQNLENDGIFDVVKVNTDTGGTYAKGTEIVSKPGDNVGIRSDGTLSDGSASVQPSLAESNYELPEMSAPTSKAQKAFTPGDPAAGSSSPITASTENAPPTLQSGWGGETARFNNKMIGSGYAEYDYIPPEVSLPETANTSTDPNLFTSPKQSSYGGNEWQDKNPRGYGSFNPDGPGYRYTKEGAVVPLRPEQSYAPQTGWSPGVSHSGTPSTPASTSWSAMANANMSTPPGSFGPPGGGDQGMVAYEPGWSPSTAHTGMPSEPGVTGQDDSGFGLGTAEGWNAAGSVMKGVGGLYGAWTGMKNYQLARDAHSTQKEQWQANYNQRLKAYEDNKKLENQDIASRNRTLRARNANRTDLYTELA